MDKSADQNGNRERKRRFVWSLRNATGQKEVEKSYQMHKSKVKCAQSRVDVHPPRFFKQFKQFRDSADLEVYQSPEAAAPPKHPLDGIKVVDLAASPSGGGTRKCSSSHHHQQQQQPAVCKVRPSSASSTQKAIPISAGVDQGVLAQPQPSMNDPITVSAYNALAYIAQRPNTNNTMGYTTISRPTSAPLYRTANLRMACGVPEPPPLGSAVSSVLTSTQFIEFTTLLAQLPVADMPIVLEKAFQDACLAKQQTQAFASIPLYGDVRLDPYVPSDPL